MSEEEKKTASDRKVRRLDKKRKEKERRDKIKDRRKRGVVEQWYELQEYFDPRQIKTVNIPEADGYRTFIHGVIDEMIVVEVPSTMPAKAITEYGEKLGEMGIRALIVSDQVRFLKLRPCSPEECDLLDEADSEKKGQIIARTSGRAGSVPDGDGGSGGQPGPATGGAGGDQDDA